MIVNQSQMLKLNVFVIDLNDLKLNQIEVEQCNRYEVIDGDFVHILMDKMIVQVVELRIALYLDLSFPIHCIPRDLDNRMIGSVYQYSLNSP